MELSPALLGFDTWRPGQQQAAEAFAAGQDVSLIMPTGSGKSACYQLPAIAGEGLTIVISPLLALIKDQVDALQAKGIDARSWTSASTSEELQATQSAITSKTLKLLYVAPERLASSSFCRLMDQYPPAKIVVDEAHCVSSWGKDFRPDYLRIGDWTNSLLPRPAVFAATATASDEVVADINAKLRLRKPCEIHLGFNRANITIDVIGIRGKGTMARSRALLSAGLSRADMLPAIVYAGRRKECESLAGSLQAEGLRAVAYHAGLDTKLKHERQEGFTKRDIDVLVATNAFGMGVDISGIRSVWHWMWPMSVDAWYQEMGRAGRDGQQARTVLFAMPQGVFDLQRTLERNQPDVHDVLRLAKTLEGGRSFQSRDWDDKQIKSLGILDSLGLIEWIVDSGIQGKLTAAPDTADIERALQRSAVHRQIADVKGLIEHEGCHRRWILDYFKDPEPAEALGRCCSSCQPPDWVENYDLYLREGNPPGGAVATTKRAKPVAVADTNLVWFANGTAVGQSADETGIFESLRSWRVERANGRPAYQVCNDKALRQIAEQLPSSEEELLQLHGIGKGFVANHGESLMRLLAAWRTQ